MQMTAVRQGSYLSSLFAEGKATIYRLRIISDTECLLYPAVSAQGKTELELLSAPLTGMNNVLNRFLATRKETAAHHPRFATGRHAAGL